MCVCCAVILRWNGAALCGRRAFCEQRKNEKEVFFVFGVLHCAVGLFAGHLPSLFFAPQCTHTHRSPNWTICPFRRNFKELIEFASQHTQWTSQPAPVHCVCVLRRRRPIMAAVCSLSHISLITRCDVRFPATNLQLDTLFLFIDLHFLPSENTTRPSFFFCWCPLISINKKPHF